MGRIHKRRAIRNLTAAALTAGLVWYNLGCPMPTAELELHRTERRHLAEVSTVVWRGESSNGDALLVGLTDSHIHTYAWQSFLLAWPRAVGQIAVLRGAALQPETGKPGPVFLAADYPPMTARAELTVTLSVNDWTEERTVEGRREDGVFFFYLTPLYGTMEEKTDDALWRLQSNEDTAFWQLEHIYDAAELDAYPYTLTFFDTAGSVLSTTRHSGYLAE